MHLFGADKLHSLPLYVYTMEIGNYSILHKYMPSIPYSKSSINKFTGIIV